MQSTVPAPRRVGLPSRSQRALALALIVLLFGGLIANGGYAATHGKSITLGENLSDSQKKELLDYFGASGDDTVQIVTVAETEEAMKGIIDTPISSAYSSTALSCRDLGEGLEVKTHNITLITPSMYAMALVTAGIGDADLMVAAPNDDPAQGMSALAGMFRTWGSKPCRSGNTTKARQQLALEELALTVAIGQAFGGSNGIEIAGNLVLYTQQTVVINGLKTADEIGQAVAGQEAVQVVTLPTELRAKLVDLMVRLAAEKIDWSTFSAGWTITPTDDRTGISMQGDGIAIRNAQMTATVKAAEARTATADAKTARTATAVAALTQTAAAKSAALSDARATADTKASQTAAAVAMTSTARAQMSATPTPLPTATPEPTATPAPVAVVGKITDINGGQVWVSTSDGAPPASYTVPVGATISRDGKSSALSEVKKGDRVNLTVDGSTNAVTDLVATPPAASALSGLMHYLVFLPALALIPLFFFIRGRGTMGEPFIVKRVASA